MKSANDSSRGKIRRLLSHVRGEGVPEPDALPFASLRFPLAVIRSFLRHGCVLRGTALSFTSILSIVPFLALSFAVLKGLGVQNVLEPMILEQVTAGSEETVDRIVTYINNTNMGKLGLMGVLGVVITAIMLLGSVDDAFNAIWGVKETRSGFRKFSDYLSIIVTGPILILMAITLTQSLQSQAVVQWLVEKTYIGDFLLVLFHFVPYLSMWIALVFLYIFMPNTKVRIPSAIIGGVLAGTLWQLAQWVYVHFQVGVARYNAIYGTLAILPLFMVWIYISWLIVLLGMEVVFVHQHRRTYCGDPYPVPSFAAVELLAAAILLEMSDRYGAGFPPSSAEEISVALDMDSRVVEEVLAKLVEEGFVAGVTDGKTVYLPAKSPKIFSLEDVSGALRGRGTLTVRNLPVQWRKPLSTLLSGNEQRQRPMEQIVEEWRRGLRENTIPPR